MLSEKRYRKNDYDNILLNLKDSTQKYNLEIIYSFECFFRFAKRKMDSENILKDKNVLIIGPGKLSKKIKRKLKNS